MRLPCPTAGPFFHANLAGMSTPFRAKAYARLFRFVLNIWPCIRGTGGRITHLSSDFHELDVTLPLNWRTRNRVGTIFGGSLYASTDPFYMILLMQILGRDYVVWDKAAQIRFKKPGTRTLYARFRLSPAFIEELRQTVAREGETSFDLPLDYRDSEGTVYAEMTKTLYVATKIFYHEKLAKRATEKRKAGSEPDPA